LQHNFNPLFRRFIANFEFAVKADYDIMPIMTNAIQKLSENDITSQVFVIAPTQIDFIARNFGDSVAAAMNMRTFAPKLRELARAALVDALAAAKKQGTQKA
jgi:hypothetical protein